jgi:hypothetical protein
MILAYRYKTFARTVQAKTTAQCHFLSARKANVVIESIFGPGERLQAPESLWF